MTTCHLLRSHLHDRLQNVDTYYIPQYVHFAFDGDSVVFLNLRSDQYSMLLGPKARQFQALVLDARGKATRTITVDTSDGPSSSPLARELVTELLHCNICSETPAHDAATLTLAPISLPIHNLTDLQVDCAQHITTKDVWRFFASSAIAKWRLQFNCIEDIVRGVERRRTLSLGRDHLNLADACKLVHIYNRLRPLFPSNFMCLFDSLALLEFLAHYNIFPQWVFAIRSDPWAAHCWVQFDAIAFNQDTEQARTYLPIMAV